VRALKPRLVAELDGQAIAIETALAFFYVLAVLRMKD